MFGYFIVSNINDFMSSYHLNIWKKNQNLENRIFLAIFIIFALIYHICVSSSPFSILTCRINVEPYHFISHFSEWKSRLENLAYLYTRESIQSEAHQRIATFLKKETTLFFLRADYYIISFIHTHIHTHIHLIETNSTLFIICIRIASTIYYFIRLDFQTFEWLPTECCSRTLCWRIQHFPQIAKFGEKLVECVIRRGNPMRGKLAWPGWMARIQLFSNNTIDTQYKHNTNNRTPNQSIDESNKFQCIHDNFRLLNQPSMYIMNLHKYNKYFCTHRKFFVRKLDGAHLYSDDMPFNFFSINHPRTKWNKTKFFLCVEIHDIFDWHKIFHCQ